MFKVYPVGFYSTRFNVVQSATIIKASFQPTVGMILSGFSA